MLPDWQPAPLLLASQSPRRRDLLAEAHYLFRVQSVSIDETIPPGLAPLSVAEHLARAKADANFALRRSGEILLTADSIVVCDQAILGKPNDVEEARTTLKMLSGRTHEVITGICLRDNRRSWSTAVGTEVHFAKLASQEINWYIDSCQPFDKAGSYGIQEWIGLSRITSIRGSYSNVVGLPMAVLYEGLQRFQAE